MKKENNYPKGIFTTLKFLEVISVLGLGWFFWFVGHFEFWFKSDPFIKPFIKPYNLGHHILFTLWGVVVIVGGIVIFGVVIGMIWVSFDELIKLLKETYICVKATYNAWINSNKDLANYVQKKLRGKKK